MKVLLIVGGILILLLAVALFIGAVVVFFIARKRAAGTAAAGGPDATHPVSRPMDPGATVVADIPGRPQRIGTIQATAGPLAGRTFPIDPNGLYIGRDRTLAQVVVDSASVSKRHVWIGPRDGAMLAIDQNSTNGTYLNSTATPIAEARLSPGDILILADDVARFVYQDR